jgi:hypothetical protein
LECKIASHLSGSVQCCEPFIAIFISGAGDGTWGLTHSKNSNYSLTLGVWISVVTGINKLQVEGHSVSMGIAISLFISLTSGSMA